MNSESIVLLMNAGLMALCHGAFYFLVVGHYLFVYWPAKRRHSIPPSSLLKERDPELVLLDMEFEGLFESEKQRRKRAEQRNPIMIRLCQRLFVGFIGSTVSFITSFLCLIVFKMNLIRTFFHASLWSGCAMIMLIYFTGEYLLQQR